MRLLFILFLPLLLSHCSIQRIAVRTVGGIMEYGLEAFNEESDLQLARESLGSNLKLLEALIRADPGNTNLLFLASQGYTAYALAFIEDEDIERARLFYLRGRDYGLAILSTNRHFASALKGEQTSFEAALNTFSKADVPAVFWTAFGWGAYINISRANLEALADLWRVNAMMEFVLKHDPGYYYAGAHLFRGSIIGSTPVALGGNPERSKEHFERALQLNGGKFLMSHVYYAQTYAVQVQDRELFESLLRFVESASPDILPEARLPNAVAKRKANHLLQSIDELF